MAPQAESMAGSRAPGQVGADGLHQQALTQLPRPFSTHGVSQRSLGADYD